MNEKEVRKKSLLTEDLIEKTHSVLFFYCHWVQTFHFFGDKSTSNIQNLDKITITTCDGKKSKSMAKIFEMVFFLFYYCYYDYYCF